MDCSVIEWSKVYRTYRDDTGQNLVRSDEGSHMAHGLRFGAGSQGVDAVWTGCESTGVPDLSKYTGGHRVDKRFRRGEPDIKPVKGLENFLTVLVQLLGSVSSIVKNVCKFGNDTL